MKYIFIVLLLVALFFSGWQVGRKRTIEAFELERCWIEKSSQEAVCYVGVN